MGERSELTSRIRRDERAGASKLEEKSRRSRSNRASGWLPNLLWNGGYSKSCGSIRRLAGAPASRKRISRRPPGGIGGARPTIRGFHERRGGGVPPSGRVLRT